jgi:hypothetical protein
VPAFAYDNVDGTTYNNASTTMKIDAYSLFDSGTKVKQTGLDISAAFERIGNAWEALHLGWTGETEQTAKDFSDRYMMAVTDFFGEEGADTDSSKKVGVLTQFAGGISGAGNAYAQTESALKVAFEMFADALQEIGPPNGDRDNYVPDGATWQLPEESANDQPDGERDSIAPPVTESSDTPANPWFEDGETVHGEWTWVQTVDGPTDLRITVHDGAVWHGVEGDGVTVEVINDET